VELTSYNSARAAEEGQTTRAPTPPVMPSAGKSAARSDEPCARGARVEKSRAVNKVAELTVAFEKNTEMVQIHRAEPRQDDPATIDDELRAALRKVRERKGPSSSEDDW